MMFSIEPGRIDGERMRILARMDGQELDDRQLKRQTRAELRRRLKTWSGDENVHVGFDGDRDAPTLPVRVSAERVELPIVRAISADRWRPSFGVSQQGAVYVTHDGNWSDSSRAVFVTGISPLLDQVTAVYLRSIDPAGGRFFEREGFFASYPHEGRTDTFACVDQPGLLRRLRSSVHARRHPAVEELVVSFKAGRWPDTGVLSAMGYHVGNEGLPTRERRRILNHTFVVQLIATTPETADYVAEWGDPKTAERRLKIEKCLRGFAVAARRKTSADISAAIAHWDADLRWLKGPFGP